MTDLGSLLKAATPDPPVDVSMRDVAGLVRRRRLLAPLAASIVVVVLAAVIATFAVTRRRDAVPPARPRIVVSEVRGLHLPHPAGWAVEAAMPGSRGPDAEVYVTNSVPGTCGTVAENGCRPARALTSGQVLVVVIARLVTTNDVPTPNRVVAGVPARVDPAAAAKCPVPAQVRVQAILSQHTIVVCGGAGVDAAALLAGVYLDHPPRQDLGLVTGRLLAVGGAPGSGPRPLPGAVTVGAQTAKVSSDGAFALVVPAGTYAVSATSPLYQPGPCRVPDPVRVSAGRVTQVEVDCQEK